MSCLHIWAGGRAPHSQPWQYPWGKIGCWWGWPNRHCLHMESICMIPKPFYSEKLSNSSDLMKGKSNHVDDANFSSPLSAIMFSCKMRMERLRFCEVENNTTDTWGILIEYLLSIVIEKSCSFPMGIQLADFHWCSAKKAGNEVQLFKEIKLHSENSVITWY